LLIEPLICSNF